jgi:hypothetical protein
VRKDLDDMEELKARGTDGMPAIFYKEVIGYCW